MIGQNNHEAQAESRPNAAGKNPSLNNTKDQNHVESSRVDLQTLEENIVSKVRYRVYSVMTTVETRIHDVVMTAKESFIIPMVELAMKSVKVLCGYGVGNVVLDPDQSNFPGNIEALQTTASSRINSLTDLYRIDETRCNNTIEGGDLLVNKKNIYRQTHTHHSNLNCRLENLSI